MKTRTVYFTFLGLLTALVMPVTLRAQNKPVRIAEIGWPMPDFRLAALQGGEYSISGLKGRNILLVFSRGRVQDSLTWCNICQYQYADFADLENTGNIRQKYDLEILFVLPYDRKTVENWVSSFPAQMEEIESWKNPPDSLRNNEGAMKWAAKARVLLPKKFVFEKGEIPIPFPILMDPDKVVSKGLDLFRTEWGGSKVDQNIPAVFLIDKEGVVQFKYLSQKTTDRPGSAYLLNYLDKMMRP